MAQEAMWVLRSAGCCSESWQPHPTVHADLASASSPSSLMVIVNPLRVMSLSTTRRYLSWGRICVFFGPPFPQLPIYPHFPPTPTPRPALHCPFLSQPHLTKISISTQYPHVTSTFAVAIIRSLWIILYYINTQETGVLEEETDLQELLGCENLLYWATMLPRGTLEQSHSNRKGSKKGQVKIHAQLWWLISMVIMYNFFSHMDFKNPSNLWVIVRNTNFTF
jgi:hypothetical protein